MASRHPIFNFLFFPGCDPFHNGSHDTNIWGFFYVIEKLRLPDFPWFWSIFTKFWSFQYSMQIRLKPSLITWLSRGIKLPKALAWSMKGPFLTWMVDIRNWSLPCLISDETVQECLQVWIGPHHHHNPIKEDLDYWIAWTISFLYIFRSVATIMQFQQLQLKRLFLLLIVAL